MEATAMIERSKHEGILTLRLAHGKVSAIDVELLDALLRELDGVAEDVRALILTGTGSIFSAGVDLFRLTQEGADYVRRFLPLLSRFVRTLFTFPRPVVAAVNGHAIAGGCVIVLACDVRLMAEGAGTIGMPELLVGVTFPADVLEVVRFAVPQDKVQSLLYTGRTVPPQEALTAGLVDEVAQELKALIEAKLAGQATVVSAPAATILPLLEALKKSVGTQNGKVATQPVKDKTPRKRARRTGGGCLDSSQCLPWRRRRSIPKSTSSNGSGMAFGR